MKTIVINAGPKRKDVNAQLAQSALKGAESVGADTEYVDLYKLDLHGCMNCSICKKDEETCKCYWRDDLSPLIEKIFNADSLIIAVPIFFSQPSSHFMAFLERLIYSLVSYNSGNKFKGKVDVALFYSINYPLDYFEKSVRPHIRPSEDLFKMLNGDLVVEAFHFVSKNFASKLSEDELKLRDEQFRCDLDTVFEIGVRLGS
jgi:multimeric flavodoxin WrbA